MKFTVAGLLSIIFLSSTKSQEATSDQICPIGQFTKPAPSPETNLKACKEYQCNSCCTAELTEQLALVPLQMVGGLNYSQCDGGLSSACSQYMSYIQCFYQCSPNIYPWLSHLRRLVYLPVCSSFCDNWFDACKDDRTCVDGTDWTRGFQFVRTGKGEEAETNLQCKANVPCKKYSEVKASCSSGANVARGVLKNHTMVNTKMSGASGTNVALAPLALSFELVLNLVYRDSVSFCTQMWAGSVQYEKDESKCIIPGDQAHNEQVVKAKEGENAPFSMCETVHYTDTGMIVGIVVGVIAGLAMIAALSIYIYRKKQAKDYKKGKAAKEMDELNGAESDD